MPGKRMPGRKEIAFMAAMASGCVPPPDQWGENQGSQDSAQSVQVEKKDKLEYKRGEGDWDSEGRIKESRWLKERVSNWDEALGAQKYYRYLERRFDFYGSYSGYDNFKDFLSAYPQLKENSELFVESLEGVAESNYLPGLQAPVEYRELFKKYGKDQEKFLLAIGAIESGFDPDPGKGSRGEVGMMQIKPSTAEGHQVYGIEDPEQNIKAAAKYYQWNLQHTHNEWLALAGYNAGLSRVQEGLMPALPDDFEPIDIIRTMKKLPDYSETNRDYLIKAALVLDYIDLEDAKGLASRDSVVEGGLSKKDKYYE